MHNPESVLENETWKVLGDFEIQIDQLIPARRPDLWNMKVTVIPIVICALLKGMINGLDDLKIR